LFDEELVDLCAVISSLG